APGEVAARLRQDDAGQYLTLAGPGLDDRVRARDPVRVRLGDEHGDATEGAAPRDLDAEHVGVARGDRDDRAERAHPGDRVVVHVAGRVPEQVAGGGAHDLGLLPDADARLARQAEQVGLELL